MTPVWYLRVAVSRRRRCPLGPAVGPAGRAPGEEDGSQADQGGGEGEGISEEGGIGERAVLGHDLKCSCPE